MQYTIIKDQLEDWSSIASLVKRAYCDLVLRDAERVNNPADHFGACSTQSFGINWKTGPLLQASYSVRYCDLVLRDAERVNNPADHFGAGSTEEVSIIKDQLEDWSSIASLV